MRPRLEEIASWREARAAARAAHWSLLATGDWSWVHVSPDGTEVWRIAPWDPAFDLFATAAADFANPHLPRLMHHVHHEAGGSSTIMERLEPIEAGTAKRWLEHFDAATAGPVSALRLFLKASEIGRDLALFRGLDRNPANVLRRQATGELVFTDAYWIDGPALLQLVRAKPQEALDLFPAAALENWAHLPCMDEPTTQMILRQVASARRL